MRKLYFSILILIFVLSMSVSNVKAIACEEFQCQSGGEDLTCFEDKKNCLEENLTQTQQQKVTLTNTISIINGKVQIQEIQIQQTESEIAILTAQISDLTQRIGGLNLSLDRLTTLLVERVQQEYKQNRVNPVLYLLDKNSSPSTFFSKLKYLQEAREQTAIAMERAESQRLLYDDQKASKEQKQEEIALKQEKLEKEQQVLAKQRTEQQYLLSETKNNESVYQKELAKTLAEINAIQSIIAGKGSESKVGEIKAGDVIASIIQGASVCSTGSHLHFEVVKDKVNRDPAAYLSSVDINWSNSPDGSFGFGGSWEWPVFDPARITQGYGMTYYARVRRAYGGSPHTGIDMVSKSGDYRIRAVQSGTLSRGSIDCGGGNLRYVKVEQADGISTYYLHVNY